MLDETSDLNDVVPGTPESGHAKATIPVATDSRDSERQMPLSYGGWTYVDTHRTFRLPVIVRQMLGFTGHQPVSLEAFIGCFDDADEGAALKQALVAAALDQQPFDLHLKRTAADGSAKTIRIAGSGDCRADPRPVAMGLIRVMDTARGRSIREEGLLHDSLTGFLNRPAFLRRIAGDVASADSATEVLLLIITINHFKDVNEVHGHRGGDAVLQAVAKRLMANLGGSFALGRLGADEFAAVGTIPAAEPPTSDKLLEQVMGLSGEAIDLTTGSCRVNLSVGMAIGSRCDEPPEVILEKADVALQISRGSGRGVLFELPMLERKRARKKLLTEFGAAIPAGELVLHYQPIVDIGISSIRGLEALIRWNHPTRGLLFPGDFMEALRDPRFAVALGTEVLNRGLDQMRRWDELGLATPCLNINVTEAELLQGGEFIDRILSGLADRGLTPDRLKIEIVETALLSHRSDEIAATIATLQNAGVVAVLDDFGTGYACLAHIKTLGVTRLKIDKSFIDNICSDPRDAAVVTAVIGLGHSLGARVTAEGVETAEQLAFLENAGCNCVQGYFFSKPLPADLMTDYLLH